MLELERDFGMEAVIRAVDGCDEEQVRNVAFCLLVSYAADSRRDGAGGRELALGTPRLTLNSRSGEILGRTRSHAPNCKWALAVEHKLVNGPYHRMRASNVPAHVERCTYCGGGR